MENTDRSQAMIYLVIGLAAIVSALVGVALGYYLGQQNVAPDRYAIISSPSPAASSLPGEGVICTLDAKICPDGSSVGRTGPNCEFAACPGETGTTQNMKRYEGRYTRFTLSYPRDFTYEIADVLDSPRKYERVVFQPTTQVSTVRSFSLYVTETIDRQATLPEYPMDREPTGTLTISGRPAVYVVIPDVYQSIGGTNPATEIYVYLVKDKYSYEFTFIGAESIDDPIVQQVIKGFTLQ